MNEDQLIGWLRNRTQSRMIGDDAAVVESDAPWVITMDTQISDVHFPRDLSPAQIARRLLAVNLSDLAAMGAEPTVAFLALATPEGFDHRAFFDALVKDCRHHGLELAGGDLARASQITAVMTLLGQPAGENLLRRSKAQPGQKIWAGGTLGESAAGYHLVALGARIIDNRVEFPQGLDIPQRWQSAAQRAVLRHLQPTPQLALGRWLTRHSSVAALDISDGLARDLHRLCRESDVGAEINMEKIPRSTDLAELAALVGRTWTDLALSGGEDYVLLFTLPRELEPPRDFGCTAIGSITADRSVHLVDRGRRITLEARGWDHLTAKDPVKGVAP